MARCRTLPTIDARTELIHWHLVEDKMPDGDMTVLINAPDLDEPVWLGWHDGEADAWRDTSGAPIKGVRAWAELPKGLFA